VSGGKRTSVCGAISPLSMRSSNSSRSRISSPEGPRMVMVLVTLRFVPCAAAARREMVLVFEA